MQSNRETLISNVQNDIKMATFGKLTQVVTKMQSNLSATIKWTKVLNFFIKVLLISDYASIYNLSINFTNFNELTDQYFTKIQLILTKIRYVFRL